MFEHIQPYAGDPIFALVDAFNADARPSKVNLSIGIYFDEQGRLPVLPSVQAAEARILAEGGAKPYLPMEGDAACCAQVAAAASAGSASAKASSSAGHTRCRSRLRA